MGSFIGLAWHIDDFGIGPGVVVADEKLVIEFGMMALMVKPGSQFIRLSVIPDFALPIR